MDLKIANKRALVCASSKGLGKAIAKALATEGVELFLCARSEDELKKTADELKAISGKRVCYQTCDLSSAQSRQELISAVHDVFGGLDILIHNAGGPPPTSVTNTTLEAWQSGFDMNFLSIVQLNQAFLPGMQQQGWGRILAVTSLSPMEPIPDLAVSNGIRAGVTAMLKTLATEVAKDGVCINCVAPGIIYTDRTEERVKAHLKNHGGEREDILKQYASAIPVGRLGKPDEYAAMVCFLCSEQAAYITGTTVVVDGGKRKATF